MAHIRDSIFQFAEQEAQHGALGIEWNDGKKKKKAFWLYGISHPSFHFVALSILALVPLFGKRVDDAHLSSAEVRRKLPGFLSLLSNIAIYYGNFSNAERRSALTNS